MKKWSKIALCDTNAYIAFQMNGRELDDVQSRALKRQLRRNNAIWF